MTHTSTEQERAEFEARFKHLDLSKEPDSWGVPRYKHDAISLAWDAWQAARRPPQAMVIDELLKQRAELLEALKKCRFDSLNMSIDDLKFIIKVITKVEGRS